MIRAISRLIHNVSPDICMDVAAWASQSGYPVKLLHPPVIDEVSPYIHDDRIAQEEFIKHRAVLERSQTLVTIEDATIRDAVSFVERPGGQICYEGNWWLPYLQDHPAYKRRFALKRRQLSGNVYSLLCLWATEFYHWFHDVLPRLETALPHLPADTRFLINSNPKTWQLGSLSAFGIKSDQLEIQPAGVHTRAERLWFATPVGHTTLGSGAVIKRVANRLRRHFVENNSEKKSRRLHISRRKTKFRRIVNENEIIALIEERGFETVLCEELPLREQVKWFSATVAMVGVHGAGLTNLIYCASGSYIGEIYTGRVFPHYLVTARRLGLSFGRFEADPAGEGDIDMQVNPPAFRKWISDCLARAEPISPAETSRKGDVATRTPDLN